MTDQKPIFKRPYDIKDVSALFVIVAIFLVITAILGNNLFGIFQENVNFGQIIEIFKNQNFKLSKIQKNFSYRFSKLDLQKIDFQRTTLISLLKIRKVQREYIV